MTSINALLIAFCILTEIARELCFKRAVDEDEKQEKEVSFLHMVFKSPLIWLGIVFWGAELIAWIVVLETVPLNVAFPLMSLVYCGVPIAGRYLLKETMTRQQWISAGIITVGVALVGFTGV